MKPIVYFLFAAICACSMVSMAMAQQPTPAPAIARKRQNSDGSPSSSPDAFFTATVTDDADLTTYDGDQGDNGTIIDSDEAGSDDGATDDADSGATDDANPEQTTTAMLITSSVPLPSSKSTSTTSASTISAPAITGTAGNSAPSLHVSTPAYAIGSSLAAVLVAMAIFG